MARRVLHSGDRLQLPGPLCTVTARGTPASYLDCRLRGVRPADSTGIGISFDAVGAHPGSEVRIHLTHDDAIRLSRLIVESGLARCAWLLDVAIKESAERRARELEKAERGPAIRRSRKVATAKSPKRKAVRR